MLRKALEGAKMIGGGRATHSLSPISSSASSASLSSSKDTWLSDDGYDEYGQPSNASGELLGAARQSHLSAKKVGGEFTRAPRQHSAPPLPHSPRRQTLRRASNASSGAAGAGRRAGRGGEESRAESGYESLSPATTKRQPLPSASITSSASTALRQSLAVRSESRSGDKGDAPASSSGGGSGDFRRRPHTADATLGSSATADDPVRKNTIASAAARSSLAAPATAGTVSAQLQASLQYDDFAHAHRRSVSTDLHSARLSTARPFAAPSASSVAAAAATWTSSSGVIAYATSTAMAGGATAYPRERGSGSSLAPGRLQADGVGRRRTVEQDHSHARLCASARERIKPGEASAMDLDGTGLSPKQAAFKKMQQSTAELARAAEEWQRKMMEAAAKTARRKRLAGGRSYRTAALMKQASSRAKLQASIRGTAMRLDERDRSGSDGPGDSAAKGASSPELQRQRPWAERPLQPKRAGAAHVEIHYEKCLPSSQWIECKPKTFVTNHKYGNAYEIRVNKKTRAANPRLAFLWENDCQVWLLEKRREVALLRQQAPGRGRALLRLKSGGGVSGVADSWDSADAAATAQSSKSERGLLRRAATEATSSGVMSGTAAAAGSPGNQWKLSDGQSGSGPMTSDVFEKFDNWAKESRRRRVAALKIQTHVRRWLVTSFIDRLKVTAIEKHGVEYAKLAAEYKSLLRRIQRRLGIRKPSAPFGLLEFKQFLDRKEAYEAVFKDVTKDTGGALQKKKLLKFLNECKFYPLEREVNLAFDQVFRGCGTQADVVVLLDCSASIGQLAFDFQLNFVRDLARHLDLGRDKVRLAVVPYNDNVFGVIDFDSYTNASDLAPLLEHLTYDEALAHGKITRTDLALRFMVDMMTAASRLSTVNREGSKVPKICITFTDGSCYYTQLTDHWADKAKADLSVNMFAIAVGKAPEKGELLKIASSPENVLDLYDYKTLHVIKSAIIGQSCLRDCPLCQFTKQQSEQEGGGATGRCADERRGLYKPEALELLWMLYPPPAAGLRKYRQTTWMGSMVESNDAVRLTKLRPGDADFRTCLRKAIEDQMDRCGEITLPSETGVMANKYTSVDEALACINRLCFSKLPATGLTNSSEDDETWRTLNDRALLQLARDDHQEPVRPPIDG